MRQNQSGEAEARDRVPFAANLPRSKRETRLLSRSKKFVDQLRDHSLCQFRVLGLTSLRSAHQMRQKAVDPICED